MGHGLIHGGTTQLILMLPPWLCLIGEGQARQPNGGTPQKLRCPAFPFTSIVGNPHNEAGNRTRISGL